MSSLVGLAYDRSGILPADTDRFTGFGENHGNSKVWLHEKFYTSDTLSQIDCTKGTGTDIGSVEWCEQRWLKEFQVDWAKPIP